MVGVNGWQRCRCDAVARDSGICWIGKFLFEEFVEWARVDILDCSATCAAAPAWHVQTHWQDCSGTRKTDAVLDAPAAAASGAKPLGAKPPQLRRAYCPARPAK
eukprot:9113819-Pyramimonas_sp.AAC.1